MGAFVAPRGKKGGYSGYYFHVEPCGTNAPGRTGISSLRGFYCPLPEVLRSVRDEILDNGAEMKQPSVRRKGFVLDESNKLKRLPKGYAPGSPYDEMAETQGCLYHRTPRAGVLCWTRSY